MYKGCYFMARSEDFCFNFESVSSNLYWGAFLVQGGFLLFILFNFPLFYVTHR